MSGRTKWAGRLRALAWVAGISLAAGGCLTPSAAARAAASSPVEMIGGREASGIPWVTLRNRSGRTQEVDLDGLAYAGHGGVRTPQGRYVRAELWDHWWTQRGVRLAPHGSWSALIHVERIEKIEARDPYSRLLGVFDLRRLPPDQHWDRRTAISRTTGWQPFRRAELFGQRVSEFSPGGSRIWQTIPPSQLPRDPADFDFVRPAVIGDARAEALTPEQLDGLRSWVERGRTLVICGGRDWQRLLGRQHAGLLVAPVRGWRWVPALRSLAQRYGAPALDGPVPVSEAGRVAPPARVAVEEGGVPLVIERPFGSGLLVLVTFDPTRPPFRGSSIERPFWQERLGRTADEYWDVGIDPGSGAAYERIRKEQGLMPPAPETVLEIWLGYLLLLALVIFTARRRIRAVAILSLAGSAVALALGPTLRGLHPAGAAAGRLTLVSGDESGWWWGRLDLMMPSTGLVSFRTPAGFIDNYWDSPRIRMAGAPEVVVRPLLRRWTAQESGLDGPARLPGGVEYSVELERNALYARVRNGTPQHLTDLAVVWGRSLSARLSDLSPGQEARRPLGRVGTDGDWTGPQEGIPQVYVPGQRDWKDTDPRFRHPPVLLARAAVYPPHLTADGRRVPLRGETALLVIPAVVTVKRAFYLPRDLVAVRVVRLRGPRGTWGRQSFGGRLILNPHAEATFEVRLPAGAGRARWHSLKLLVEHEAGLTCRAQLFDWERLAWVPVLSIHGRPSSPPARPFAPPFPEPPWPMRQSVALTLPGRFVNRETDAMLVRVENEGDQPSGAEAGVTGDGQAG